MNIFFISDPHFNHTNITKFFSNGQKLRPFDDVETMNETIIENWNKVVGPYDKIYCLGDVGFNTQKLGPILDRLHGKKRLILGNHDQYDMKFYRMYFEKILVTWRPKRSLIISHYPLLISNNEPKIRANLHGHTHGNDINDPRYLNISIEKTNYSPIHYDQIVEIYKSRGIEIV